MLSGYVFIGLNRISIDVILSTKSNDFVSNSEGSCSVFRILLTYYLKKCFNNSERKYWFVKKICRPVVVNKIKRKRDSQNIQQWCHAGKR